MRLLVKTRPTRLPTPDPRSKPKFDVARHRRSKGHYTTALRLAGVKKSLAKTKYWTGKAAALSNER